MVENITDYEFMSVMVLEVRNIVVEFNNKKLDNKTKQSNKKSDSQLARKFGG